jgi:predicted PurR-regulated permease PerM
VLLLVYISTLLAVGFSPAVHWFEHRRMGWLRRRFSRGASILIFYVLCLVLILVLLAIIVPPFVVQAGDLWQAMPTYFERGQQILIARGWLHSNWTWTEVLAKIPSPELAVTSLVGVFESVVGALAALATIAVLPYYLLVEADDLQDGFLRFVPADRRERLERITDDLTLKVGAWLGSQMLLCVIIGALASLSMWLIGVPYFYVLGLIAGLGELVPVVGPLIAATPAVIAGWTISTETMFIVASYFVAQQIFENYVLIPRIMQKRVGVSAVTVIVSLLIGTELLGVIGALLAVPTAAIVQVLLNEFLLGE